MNRIIGAFVVLLGLGACGLFISAGLQLDQTGRNMTDLRSRGGESVAEVYYQEVGRFGIAGSHLAYALGLGSLMLSLGLGGLLMTSQSMQKQSDQESITALN